MTQSEVLKWHKNAVLMDRTVGPVGVDAVATAAIACPGDPKCPATALPDFFAALAAGKQPLIGQYVGTVPDSGKGGFITMTGGSTGQPKMVLRSCRSWQHSIDILSDRLGIGPQSRVAALGDLSHSLALYAAIEALVLGAEFHPLARLSRLETAKALSAQSITHLYVTPTQIRLLADRPAASVQHVIVGGGALDPATRQKARALFPQAEITAFYGASETSFITIADRATPHGSAGQAFPGVDIAIRDTHVTDLATGSEGLVWVRSPMAFEGYIGVESASTQRDGDWITVGEIGSLDWEGNLFLSGRADRMVNVADTIVSLEQIEAHLRTHPAVQEAACFAQDDPLRGTRIVAVLQADPEPERPDLLASLPRASHPAIVRYLDGWARLASGKDDLTEIRRRAGL